MSHYKGNSCHSGERDTCSECSPNTYKETRREEWERIKQERIARSEIEKQSKEGV